MGWKSSNHQGAKFPLFCCSAYLNMQLVYCGPNWLLKLHHHVPHSSWQERGKDQGRACSSPLKEWLRSFLHISLSLTSHWSEYNSRAIPSIAWFSMSFQTILSWDLPSKDLVVSRFLHIKPQPHGMLSQTEALENEWNCEKNTQQVVRGLRLSPQPAVGSVWDLHPVASPFWVSASPFVNEMIEFLSMYSVISF